MQRLLCATRSAVRLSNSITAGARNSSASNSLRHSSSSPGKVVGVPRYRIVPSRHRQAAIAAEVRLAGQAIQHGEMGVMRRIENRRPERRERLAGGHLCHFAEIGPSAVAAKVFVYLSR